MIILCDTCPSKRKRIARHSCTLRRAAHVSLHLCDHCRGKLPRGHGYIIAPLARPATAEVEPAAAEQPAA